MEIFVALLLIIFSGPVVHYLFKIKTVRALSMLTSLAFLALCAACYTAYRQDVSLMYFCLDIAAIASSIIHWCPAEADHG